MALLGKRKFWVSFFLLAYTIGFFITIGINQLERNLIIFAYPIGVLGALWSIVTLPLQLFMQLDPFSRSAPSYNIAFTVMGFVLLVPYLMVLIAPARSPQRMRLALLITIILISLLAMRGCTTSSWDVLQW